MAGGTFISQNKIRPGAYLNFKSVSTPSIKVGSRGIVTFAMELDWGAEGKLIDVYSSDMTSGDSLAKVGLTAFDKTSKLLNLALSNAYLAKIYRLNKGGEKAKTTAGSLTVTAKYSGTFGNKIAIIIQETGDGAFIVDTYADGYAVDSQKAATIADLVNNDYVEFSGEGDLTAITSTLLTGGTNGTAAVGNYTEYFNLLKTAQWQTLAIVQDADEVNKLAAQFIEEMRDAEGKYVQLVLANYDDADYEGIINNVSSVVIDGEEITVDEFNAYVAGITAGASVVESNTGKVIEGATSIINPLSNDEIIAALKAGKFVVSLNQDGAIKVEKDINSLHKFTEDRSYTFSKNRVIRTLDEIGTSISSIWENTYLGKVSNNDAGRTLFKSSIINYLTELQNIGAIQNLDIDKIEVIAGSDIDSVVANIAIQPVDSMEILYMTINVMD